MWRMANGLATTYLDPPLSGPESQPFHVMSNLLFCNSCLSQRCVLITIMIFHIGTGIFTFKSISKEDKIDNLEIPVTVYLSLLGKSIYVNPLKLPGRIFVFNVCMTGAIILWFNFNLYCAGRSEKHHSFFNQRFSTYGCWRPTKLN